VNCAGFGNRLHNDKAALPFLFWQNGSDGSLSSGSQFKFLTNHLGEEMTTQLQKAKRFHKLHVSGEPLVLFNIWDPGSAKAVAETGAKALATSSWAVSEASGYSDGEHTPLTFAIDNLRRITEATELPVTVDVESGYGDTPRKVGETIALAIKAGAIGCNLEDSFPENGSLRETKHQVDRIRHARQKADETNVSFFINARTDVFIQVSQDEHDASLVAKALERAKAYAGAGADGLFVPGLADLALIAELTKASPLPVNIMVSQGANISALAKRGVARVSFGADPYVITISALQEAARKAIPQ
jgi:2-methylisocitrate lyase-like PEP mutase family enzyme